MAGSGSALCSLRLDQGLARPMQTTTRLGLGYTNGRQRTGATMGDGTSTHASDGAEAGDDY